MNCGDDRWTDTRVDDSTSSRDAISLTDLNCGTSSELSEVELFSLIEDQLPRYQLRLDAQTEFSGYGHRDWIQAPLLPTAGTVGPTDDDLTDVEIEETLKYFVMCADRVNQMTKTYSDQRATSQLLEEKEHDLELAAQIGQSLLSRNKKLERKNAKLEEKLQVLTEKISQLRHELHKKHELLKTFLHDSADEDGSDDSFRSEVSAAENSSVVRSLQNQVEELTAENDQLRGRIDELLVESDQLERSEDALVADCVKQIGETQKAYGELEVELVSKNDTLERQQEDITNLLSQVVDLQAKLKKALLDHDEVCQNLRIARDAQRQLTKELIESENHYREASEALGEAQSEIRRLRARHRPRANKAHFCPNAAILPAIPSDSLAFELRRSSSAVQQAQQITRRTMDVVRQRSLSSAPRLSSLNSTNSTSGHESGEMSDCESIHSEDYHADNDSVSGSRPSSGRLGSPRRRVVSHGSLSRELSADGAAAATPTNECCCCEQEEEEGDESELTGSFSSGATATPPYFRLPEKLKIVKPLEGSLTLYQWQRLATPGMGSLFEQIPGVTVKGEDADVFRDGDCASGGNGDDDADDGEDGEDDGLSDVEPDDDILPYYQHDMIPSSTTHTFTTSSSALFAQLHASPSQELLLHSSTPPAAVPSSTAANQQVPPVPAGSSESSTDASDAGWFPAIAPALTSLVGGLVYSMTAPVSTASPSQPPVTTHSTPSLSSTTPLPVISISAVPSTADGVQQPSAARHPESVPALSRTSSTALVGSLHHTRPICAVTAAGSAMSPHSPTPSPSHSPAIGRRPMGAAITACHCASNPSTAARLQNSTQNLLSDSWLRPLQHWMRPALSMSSVDCTASGSGSSSASAASLKPVQQRGICTECGGVRLMHASSSSASDDDGDDDEMDSGASTPRNSPMTPRRLSASQATLLSSTAAASAAAVPVTSSLMDLSRLPDSLASSSSPTPPVARQRRKESSLIDALVDRSSMSVLHRSLLGRGRFERQPSLMDVFLPMTTTKRTSMAGAVSVDQLDDI